MGESSGGFAPEDLRSNSIKAMDKYNSKYEVWCIDFLNLTKIFKRLRVEETEAVFARNPRTAGQAAELLFQHTDSLPQGHIQEIFPAQVNNAICFSANRL